MSTKRIGAALSEGIQQEPFKTALRAAWHTTSREGFFAHYVAGDGLARMVATPDITRNEDDRNVIEFGFARAVGHTERPLLLQVRDAARQLGVSEPTVDGVRLDPSRLRTELVDFYAATGFVGDISPAGSATERARQTAVEDFYRNNVTDAQAHWKQQTEGPRNPVELAMLATIAADSGSDEALPYIEQIRRYEPAEADGIVAQLRSKQGRDEDTAKALESALALMGSDLWLCLVPKSERSRYPCNSARANTSSATFAIAPHSTLPSTW